MALIGVEVGADEVQAGRALHELAVAPADHAHGALLAHHLHERSQPPVAWLQRLPAEPWTHGALSISSASRDLLVAHVYTTLHCRKYTRFPCIHHLIVSHVFTQPPHINLVIFTLKIILC